MRSPCIAYMYALLSANPHVPRCTTFDRTSVLRYLHDLTKLRSGQDTDRLPLVWPRNNFHPPFQYYFNCVSAGIFSLSLCICAIASTCVRGVRVAIFAIVYLSVRAFFGACRQCGFVYRSTKLRIVYLIDELMRELLTMS